MQAFGAKYIPDKGLHVVVNRAAFSNSRYNCAEVIICQHHVCCFLCNLQSATHFQFAELITINKTEDGRFKYLPYKNPRLCFPHPDVLYNDHADFQRAIRSSSSCSAVHGGRFLHQYQRCPWPHQCLLASKQGHHSHHLLSLQQPPLHP